MICIIQSDTGIHIREKKRETRNPGVLVQAVKFELFENVMKGAGGSIFMQMACHVLHIHLGEADIRTLFVSFKYLFVFCFFLQSDFIDVSTVFFFCAVIVTFHL